MTARLFTDHPSSAGSGQQQSLSVVVESYLSYYAGQRSHTSRAKRLDLKTFLAFVALCHGVSIEKLKMRDWDQSITQRFVDDRLRMGEAPATVARRLATLKHMGRVLAERIPGFTNPAREVKPPRIEAMRPKALTRGEEDKVKARARGRADQKKSFIRIRNEMIVNLLLDTGIRADEVRLLKRGQLDQKLEWISEVRTKGRRFRSVYVTTAVRALLKAYLEERARELRRFFPNLKKSVDEALPLFPSSYGAVPARPETFVMGAKTLWRAVHECSAEQSLHPHLLRHSFATELLNHSGDIRLVSQALGHSDVKVTMRYTERRGEEVARALEKARRGKRKSKK